MHKALIFLTVFTLGASSTASIAAGQAHPPSQTKEHGQHPKGSQEVEHAAGSQHDHHSGAPAAQEHAGHSAQHGQMSRSAAFLMGQSSGTSYQPAAWPMPMLMTHTGGWRLMWMGQGILAATQQSGPRGADKVYSANWGMLSAARDWAGGTVMFRSMLSLEPATVRGQYYPLLFQTGETAFGRPLVDGQHPHDLFMELSAQYARPLGERGLVHFYYAPVGDAALGPVAFPHRASAMEIPQATLAHHWQDSTHIAANVATAGVAYGPVRLEASGFHGREPDENRWDLDWGPIDSWSSRLTVSPSRNWTTQVSVGRLNEPEATHPGDVVRTTASLHHILPRQGGNSIATSFIWARNYKTIERPGTHAVVAESVVPFWRRNFLTGRLEWSQRDELFADDHDLEHEVEERTGKDAFGVTGYTFGYTRDFALFPNVQTGIGANFTLYSVDRALEPYYGRHPRAVSVFLRVRLKNIGEQ